jgi:hypothetical protein
MRGVFIRITAMLHKLVGAAAIIVLLAGPSYAQVGSNNPGTGGGSSNPAFNLMPSSKRNMTMEEIQREQEIESKYNQIVNDKIPDKKPVDPWGNVRPTPSASKQR